MPEPETVEIDGWHSFVERACLDPKSVSIHGSFEEVIAYINGGYQGMIFAKESVPEEAQVWFDLYDYICRLESCEPDTTLDVFKKFRARFMSDKQALEEFLRIFEQIRKPTA
jgi:lantibiotic modifying enzyme